MKWVSPRYWQRDSETLILRGGVGSEGAMADASEGDYEVEAHDASLIVGMTGSTFTMRKEDGSRETLSLNKAGTRTVAAEQGRPEKRGEPSPSEEAEDPAPAADGIEGIEQALDRAKEEPPKSYAFRIPRPGGVPETRWRIPEQGASAAPAGAGDFVSTMNRAFRVASPPATFAPCFQHSYDDATGYLLAHSYP